jgi:hypothetical protein
MYSTTEVSSVSQGTVIADRPEQQRDDGREGEHHDGVVQRHLAEREQRVAAVSRLHTNTIAVQGAAASRIRPAM